MTSFKRASVALLASLLFVLPAGAQPPSAASGQERSVMVILVERFARGSLGAVIERSVGPGGRDLVAIRRDDLSPELLDALLQSLAQSRARHGHSPSTRVTELFVHGAKYRPLDPARREELTRRIAELTAVPPHVMPGVGVVSSTTWAAIP